MASDKQKAASRANGAKSRGPVTPEGKARSAASRRRAVSDSVLLAGESNRLFHELLEAVERELRPETPIEHAIVEKMCVYHWRQMRMWGFERSHISRAVPGSLSRNAESTGSNPETLASYAFLNPFEQSAFLRDYESECDRQFFRNLSEFLRYRAARKYLEGSQKRNDPTNALIPNEMGSFDGPETVPGEPPTDRT